MYKGSIVFLVLLIAVACFGQHVTTIYEIQSNRDPVTQWTNWIDSLVIVEGIVTCDYGVTGSYNFFLEMKQGGPWSGIMVYVPETPAGCFEVDVGDSLIVTGTVLEYYDNTELRIDDTTLVERCGSIGLPPVTVISAAHLDTTLSSSLYLYQPDSAEKYEGVLVQVQNAFVTDPLDVNNNWEISDGYGYATVLNNYTYTPGVGDFLNVAGIVHTHYDIYKIRPRDINDIEVLGEGRLSVVYSTSRTGVNVQFTRDVDDVTAGNTANYEIIPVVTVTGASRDADDFSLVHLVTGTQTDAQLCTLVVDGVEDIGGNLICDTMTFYSGFVPITTIQSDTASGDPEFASLWDGRLVTLTGIITAESECFYIPAWYWIQQVEGPWSGIMAYHPGHTYITTRGDSVVIAGGIEEYYGMTEILDIIYYNIESSGNTILPSEVNSGDLNAVTGAIAEQWEAVLVMVDTAEVVDAGTDPGNSPWDIDDGTGRCIVSNYEAYTYEPDSGNLVNVTGVTRFDNGFNLYPRDDGDIDLLPHGIEDHKVGYFDIALLFNPVSRSSGVLLTIPKRSSVELSLYNLAGRRIADIKQGILEAGVHELTLDIREIPNGVYFYRFKTENRSLTRKVVILK
ncbi:T9SS type A sorting domain-containing protein [candidate division WOR-3 bacterium]|nr:T9SS type A sorting domain-containing protein [candidate division WOR-3 bacterium]